MNIKLRSYGREFESIRGRTSGHTLGQVPSRELPKGKCEFEFSYAHPVYTYCIIYLRADLLCTSSIRVGPFSVIILLYVLIQFSRRNVIFSHRNITDYCVRAECLRLDFKKKKQSRYLHNLCFNQIKFLITFTGC